MEVGFCILCARVQGACGDHSLRRRMFSSGILSWFSDKHPGSLPDMQLRHEVMSSFVSSTVVW